jgi:diadenosine tetraphosphate (Ap4A) HIT family hydrolase
MENCLICDRIDMIKKGTNKNFVAELETGYAVIGDHQYFEGYTLFLCKEHRKELHELSPDFKQAFLLEMSRVAEAVYKAFQPDKLNYELLGNGEPHLHWHIFPRRLSEPNPRQPVSCTPPEVMFADSARPGDEKREELKNKLYTALKSL